MQTALLTHRQHGSLQYFNNACICKAPMSIYGYSSVLSFCVYISYATAPLPMKNLFTFYMPVFLLKQKNVSFCAKTCTLTHSKNINNYKKMMQYQLIIRLVYCTAKFVTSKFFHILQFNIFANGCIFLKK